MDININLSYFGYSGQEIEFSVHIFILALTTLKCNVFCFHLPIWPRVIGFSRNQYILWIAFNYIQRPLYFINYTLIKQFPWIKLHSKKNQITLLSTTFSAIFPLCIRVITIMTLDIFTHINPLSFQTSCKFMQSSLLRATSITAEVVIYL